MPPIKVGIIGYGFSTTSFHLPFILPNQDLQVYAFLQRAEAPDPASNVEHGKHCTVDFPKAKHYRSPEGFFSDVDIDLVIVASHVDTHASFAEMALTAGKHVVVEKPFTRTSAEADHLLEVARNSGKVLTVYQNRRYDSDFRTLRHLVQANVFGLITDATIQYDIDFPPWMRSMSINYNPGDGLLFGLGSHSIDQAIVLFGLPDRITGHLRCLRGVESESDDTFLVVLQYDRQPGVSTGEASTSKGSGGLWVEVKTSCVAPMQYPLKSFVRGYEGSFIKYGTDPQEEQLNELGIEATDKRFGVESEETYAALTTKKKMHDGQVFNEKIGKWEGKFPSFKGEYAAFYTDLVQAIRGEKDLYVRPEQSRDGIRIIEIARESAAKGVTLAFK